MPVLQDIIPWAQSRKLLHTRLHRLLLEHKATVLLEQARPKSSYGERKAMLRRWFMEDKDSVQVFEQAMNVNLNFSKGLFGKCMNVQSNFLF